MSQKKILIILGNPKTKSFCRSLAEAYEIGARQGGAEVRLLDLRKLKFDPILWEGYAKEQELEPDLQNAQKLILWAEHLVIAFPVWWSSMPALLKGFFDRVFLPGFAFDFRPDNPLWKKHLKGRSAHVIITMGSPYLIYRTLFGKATHRAMINGILKFCGISPVRSTTISYVEDMAQEEREAFLRELEDKGKEFY
ncbi:MAG: flavodoxin family protein [Bradymonadales bacterium]|nr:MAG: flavodoxin family protein [Bradymonadales bacterium]